MDTIAQRFGLVIHWLGAIVTLYVIIISFGLNIDDLKTRVNSYSSIGCEVFNETTDSNKVKDGECYISPTYASLVEYYPDTEKYKQKKVYPASISNFVSNSFETLMDSWILFFAIVYGWLIRFILAGKIHILPYKK